MRRRPDIDNNVGHRKVKLGLGRIHHTPREPVRPLVRVRCDDHLVCGEADECVLERPARVCVADFTTRMETEFGEGRDRMGEPLLGPAAGVVVGDFVTDGCVQHGGHHQHLTTVACMVAHTCAEAGIGTRLICDHKNASAMASCG